MSVLAKWLAIERPSDDTFMRWGDYLHKAQLEERVYVYVSFVWFVYVAMCFPPALHNIYFYIACAESAVKHQASKQTNMSERWKDLYLQASKMFKKKLK